MIKYMEILLLYHSVINIKITTSLPKRYENFGIEQYFTKNNLDVQYATINPKNVMITPTGNTDA
jgi:hypothetical protein